VSCDHDHDHDADAGRTRTGDGVVARVRGEAEEESSERRVLAEQRLGLLGRLDGLEVLVADDVAHLKYGTRTRTQCA